MSYLQELIPKRKYSRWDYLGALINLFPRGWIWRIELPNELDISLYSIPSGEDFGRITISQGQTIITPNGIASQESVGIPFIWTSDSIYPVGIASGEIFGSLSLGLGLVSSSISTSELWGSPSIRNYLIWNTFESSLGTGWDSEFTDDWYQTVENGEGIAQTTLNQNFRLFPPSGQMLNGNFTLIADFWRSASEVGGNTSVHFGVKNSGGTKIEELHYYYDSHMKAVYGIAERVFGAGPKKERYKIERISGVIWCYYWNGSSWIRSDSWSTPGTSVSNSADLYVFVDGAESMNGFAEIQIIGHLV